MQTVTPPSSNPVSLSPKVSVSSPAITPRKPAIQWVAVADHTVPVSRAHTDVIAAQVAVTLDLQKGKQTIIKAVQDDVYHDLGQLIEARSSAKPFQVQPLVTLLQHQPQLAQAYFHIHRLPADPPAMTPQQLAFMCSSHDGRPEHLEVGESLLKRWGIPESALLNSNKAPLAHMCSGNHLATLLANRLLVLQAVLQQQGLTPHMVLNYPADSPELDALKNCLPEAEARMGHYLDWQGSQTPDGQPVDHDSLVQERLKAVHADLAGLTSDEPVHVVRDKCNQSSMALYAAQWAKMFAELAINPELAAQRQAMTRFPEMIYFRQNGGGQIRSGFDTSVMDVTQGAHAKNPDLPVVLAKDGADGFEGFSRLPDINHPHTGEGLVLKAFDGNRRSDHEPNPAVQDYALDMLQQVNWIDAQEAREIRSRSGLVSNTLNTNTQLPFTCESIPCSYMLNGILIARIALILNIF